MKILFIFSNYHLSHITAQPGIAYKLAHKASEQNHEVWILSNTTEEPKTKDSKVNLVLFKGLGDLTSYAKNIIVILKTFWKIRPDVVHIHGNLLTILFWILNLFFQFPFTCYISETIDILDNKYKKIYTFVLRSAKKIFVSSDYIMHQLVAGNISESKIELARLGIDDHFYTEPETRGEEYDILFYGDSKHERGFDIVAHLAKQLPNLKFLILLRWKEQDSQQYLSDIEQLPHTTVMQYPYPKPLTDYILSSKIVLLPFRFMGVRPPISILEAMIMKRCLITSTMEGNSEVISHEVDGILDSFTQLKKTKKTISSLIADELKRTQIGINARTKMLRLYDRQQYTKVISSITQ